MPYESFFIYKNKALSTINTDYRKNFIFALYGRKVGHTKAKNNRRHTHIKSGWIHLHSLQGAHSTL